MDVALRKIIWLGDTLEIVRNWSISARKRAGEELFRLQLGGQPVHWRSMKSVGAGVREIRISADGQRRVLYFVAKNHSVVVLHAFEKKTRRTAKADISLRNRD